MPASETGDEMDDETPAIKRGTRVICQKLGPHRGKRGKVVSVLGETVHVEFRSSSLVERRTYFQPVEYAEQ